MNFGGKVTLKILLVWVKKMGNNLMAKYFVLSAVIQKIKMQKGSLMNKLATLFLSLLILPAFSQVQPKPNFEKLERVVKKFQEQDKLCVCHEGDEKSHYLADSKERVGLLSLEQWAQGTDATHFVAYKPVCLLVSKVTDEKTKCRNFTTL